MIPCHLMTCDRIRVLQGGRHASRNMLWVTFSALGAVVAAASVQATNATTLTAG
jgi:hypothetical protein